MSDTDIIMGGFYAELTKLALFPLSASRTLTNVGAGAGVGSLVGAAGGAGVSGYQGYRDARHSGASRGQAAMSALGRGAKGALRGAAVGGALGAAGGAGATALGKGDAVQALAGREKGQVGSFARFGQRQVHSLTGATPEGFLNQEGVKKMRAGAWGSKKAVTSAEEALGKAKDPAGRLKAQGNLDMANKANTHAQAAEDMGLTSLPGYAKAMYTHSVGNALSTGVKEQWHSGGVGTKALIFGLPAAAAAKEAVTPTEPGGRGRLGRAAGHIPELAFSAGPLPMTGAMALSGGLNKVFGAKKPAGHLVQAPANMDPAGGNEVASSREASDRYINSSGGGV